MDIMAHSLWSLVLLPGPPSIAKVALGIAPDAAVFATDDPLEVDDLGL